MTTSYLDGIHPAIAMNTAHSMYNDWIAQGVTLLEVRFPAMSSRFSDVNDAIKEKRDSAIKAEFEIERNRLLNMYNKFAAKFKVAVAKGSY